jgi:MoaA/NifB/PqqE/SkfB family radical SAM enzyme
METIVHSEVEKSIRLGKAYRENGRCDLSVREFEKISYPGDDLYLSNLIHNEIEISQGETILYSKPRGLGITLTNKCNIRCIMCSVWQNTWDIPEKTIKEIIRLFPYLEKIFYQGGEVFLSPYFEEILDKAMLYPNLRQDINTNGLLIDKRWAEKLVKVNANIIFSIDGVTKETYEHIRRGAKFENLLKSIDILNKYRCASADNNTSALKKCSTLINLVVMKSNYHELPNFVDFARQYRFDRLQVTPVDIGNSENIFRFKDEKALNFIRDVIPEMLKKGDDYGVSVLNWLPMSGEYAQDMQAGCIQSHVATENDSKHSRHSSRPNRLSCYWPWQFLFIDWGGKIRPQCFCRKEAGNVQDESIEEIWNNQIMQEYRRRLFINDCEHWCDNRCASGSIPKESLGLDS